MTKMQIRATIPVAIGLGLGMMAGGLKFVESGASPLIYLAPAIAAAIGFVMLHKWREMAGMEETSPMLAYIAIITGVYVLFGLVYSPQGRAMPMAAVIAVAMLLPAFVELVFDHNKFKSKAEEPAKGAAYVEE